MSIPQAGITPAASFELAGFEPQRTAPAILADKIDPKTGEFLSLTEGRTIADGLVIHLLGVQRGTGASVRSFGQRFREITHNDGRSAETFEGMAREALKPGVDSGTIRIVKVTSEIDSIDGTQNENVVSYTDLLAPSKDAGRRQTFNP